MIEKNENDVEPVAKPAGKSEVKPKAVPAGTIPECPEEDPLAGDKTPAVIAWWFKYKPGEAAEKYKTRKFQQPANDV